MSDYTDRHKWFEYYKSRTEQGVIKKPQPGIRYTCPCCGYPTLEERGAFEICPLCNWEDDGQDDPHADEVWGGPNGAYSLSEARGNFKLYLSKYNPEKSKTRIAGDDSPIEIQAKHAMIEAFDSMVNETHRSVLDALWQRVSDNERILERELHRKVREYEARMRRKGNT